MDGVGTSSSRFDVEVTQHGANGVTVALRGELDIAAAPKLRETVLDLVNAPRCELTLDLADLEFLDSTGIGVIVGAWRRVEAQEGTLAIVNARRRVADAIQLVGLDRLLKNS